MANKRVSPEERRLRNIAFRPQLFERVKEAQTLIRWWLAKSRIRKRQAMWCGGFNEVEQNTFVNLLRFPPIESVAFSTAVINACRWTLGRMVEVRSKMKHGMKFGYSKYPTPTRGKPLAQEWNATERLEADERNESIKEAMRKLSYRERQIVILRYGLGDGYEYTLKEVAEVFKVTRERIRQIESKIVRKLQQPGLAGIMVGHL